MHYLRKNLNYNYYCLYLMVTKPCHDDLNNFFSHSIPYVGTIIVVVMNPGSYMTTIIV